MRNTFFHNCISGTILFLLLPFFIIAKTIYVSNPGNDKDIQPAIVNALNVAQDGDVIVLPEGKFIFNKSVTMYNPVSFLGAGIGKTVLYRDMAIPDSILSNDYTWDGMLRFIINSDIPSNIFVSGITFQSKTPSLQKNDGGSLAQDAAIRMINCLDFAIKNCRFEYFGKGAIMVQHTDTMARGLICKNEFYRNAKGYDGLNLGYGVVIYGENKQWVSSPKFGTNNFIFIEDNVFDMHRHSIAAGGCALYVARYNTIKNNIVCDNSSTHAIDTHSARGGTLGDPNYFSSRAVEIYNNTITNTTFMNGQLITPLQNAANLAERGIGIRGAEALVYKNTITGFRFGCGMFVDANPFGTSYPLPYTTGYLSGLQYGVNHTGTSANRGNGDLFYWNNSFTSYIDSVNHSSLDFYNYQPQYFKEDRDYHFIAKSGYKAYTYPHPLNLLPAGLYNPEEITNMSLFPNPVKEVLNIETDADILFVELYSSYGQLIKSLDIIHGQRSFHIDMKGLSQGVYFLNIHTHYKSYYHKVVTE